VAVDGSARATRGRADRLVGAPATRRAVVEARALTIEPPARVAPASARRGARIVASCRDVRGDTLPDRMSGTSRRDLDLWLQTCLKRLVDPDLVVDGAFGKRSRQALKDFQRGAHLDVDGVAGPATIAALESATATLAPGHRPAEPGADATEATSAAVAAEPDPTHYAERRVGVRIYGKLDGESPLLVAVPETGGSRKRLHRLAAAALERMAAAVLRDLELELKLASGWRAHRWQSRAQYESVLVAKYGSVAEGKRWLAFDSPHETGLAIDIGVGGLTPSRSTVASQREQPLFRWLVAHAWEYGFHPYKVEPWHWEHPLSREAFKTGVVADDDPGPPMDLSFDTDLEHEVIEDDDLDEYPTDDEPDPAPPSPAADP
jgi:hypothetical protein